MLFNGITFGGSMKKRRLLVVFREYFRTFASTLRTDFHIYIRKNALHGGEAETKQRIARPMISVIIPVYNVEKYLNQCVASVVAQTYTDFELLLIDDGSTDSSGQLCDQWQKRDPRIRVMHQPNQGVSAARNHGLDMAQGELVAFIDSDDWVDSDYLALMVNAMAATHADLAVSGLTQHHTDGCDVDYIPNEEGAFLLDAQHADRFTDLNQKFLLYGPCIKLYKLTLLNRYGVRFPQGVSFGEDLTFNYRYLEHVGTITCVQRSTYHYRILGSGTLSTRVRPDQFTTDYGQWQSVMAFYRRHGLFNEAAQQMLYRRLWGTVYDSIFLLPRLQVNWWSYLRTILSIPEIAQLAKWQGCFSCARWIKRAILHRRSLVFYLYFKLRRQ